MIDTISWDTIQGLFEVVTHSRKPRATDAGSFGDVHVVLFGDFKQLPPASAEAPFIVLPYVYNGFDFRVLRQNRRVAVDASRSEELEEYHKFLSDISGDQPISIW